MIILLHLDTISYKVYMLLSYEPVEFSKLYKSSNVGSYFVCLYSLSYRKQKLTYSNYIRFFSFKVIVLDVELVFWIIFSCRILKAESLKVEIWSSSFGTVDKKQQLNAKNIWIVVISNDSTDCLVIINSCK